MEMLLIQAGLWSIFSQRKLCPTLTTASGSASSSCTRRNTAGPSSNDNDAAVQKWDEDAEQATAEIFLYLDAHVERPVLKIRNPVELWGKLPTFYERKGFSSRFYLWHKLLTLKLADYPKRNEGNTIELYLDAFRSHVQQLRSSGAPVSNEIEGSALLNVFDDGYESIIVSTSQSSARQPMTISMWSNWLVSSVMGTADIPLVKPLPRLLIPILDQPSMHMERDDIRVSLINLT